MLLSVSYGKDASPSVRIKESAALVPGNLSVLQGLEEGSLAYGVIGRHRATVTYVSANAGTINSETVDLFGLDDDNSSRALTGVSTRSTRTHHTDLVCVY